MKIKQNYGAGNEQALPPTPRYSILKIKTSPMPPVYVNPIDLDRIDLRVSIIYIYDSNR